MAPDIGGSPRASRRGAPLVDRGLRYLGALLLFGIAAVHLQQYFGVHYRVIPLIGPLFLANFAIAVLLGATLLAPVERIPRLGPPLPVLAALGGAGFAAGTLIGLEISEFGALFGFHEHGYRPAVALSIAFEAAVVLTLSAFAISRRRDVATWYRGTVARR